MAAKQKLSKKLIDDTNQEMIFESIEDMDTTFHCSLKTNAYSIKYQEGVTPHRYSVYKLVNPFNREHFYIGYTSDVKSRLKSHLKGPPESNSDQGRARWELISSFLRRGETVTMEVVSTFAYRGQAMKFESAMIKEALASGERVLNANVKSLDAMLAYHLASISKI